MSLDSPHQYYRRLPVYAANYRLNDPAIADPVWFHTHYKSAGLAFHKHLHKEMELHHIVCGTMRVLLDSGEYQLHPGDILIVNPYELHQGVIDKSCVVEYTHAVFDLRFFTGNCGAEAEQIRNRICSGEMVFPSHISSEKPEAQRIAFLLNRLLESYTLAETNIPVGDCRQAGVVCELISILLEYAYPQEVSGSRRKDLEFIHKVHSYIAQHYGESLTTEKMSRALGYNKSYFCTRFKQNFHVSFSNYLNEYRVGQAAEYLHKENRTLTEISNLCGFENYNYFSRSFKKHMGVSPAVFFKR